MDRARIRNIKRELRAHVEEKRRRDELTRPCPACGHVPAADGPELQPVDADTGRDLRTGEPACDACAKRTEKHYPGAVTRIEFTPLEDPDDPDPDDPDEYDPDEAA